VANINKKNVSKEEEALELAKSDMIAFGKLFLPDDYMRSETPFFHYEVADAISDPDARQLAVILPRGHGKTVLTKCSILHDFCFTKDPLFYGWVAASSKISVPNLDYIKYHLVTLKTKIIPLRLSLEVKLPILLRRLSSLLLSLMGVAFVSMVLLFITILLSTTYLSGMINQKEMKKILAGK
jgi:hypothetical protein